MHFITEAGKLAKLAGIFYALKIKYLGSAPVSSLNGPTASVGEMQRESGTLFYIRTILFI